MDSIILLFGGLLLGCLHALDADHVCTVSALILERYPLKKTFFLALRWSLGHSLTLLVLVGLMFALRATFASWDMAKAEQVVGLSMICLGFWVSYREWRRDHHGDSTHSGVALFGMGVLHGTAGSSSVFLLIPIALSRSLPLVLAYVVLFSAGMILTMGLYSAMVNRVTWLDRLSHHLGKLRYVSAAAAVFVGFRILLQGGMF